MLDPLKAWLKRSGFWIYDSYTHTPKYELIDSLNPLDAVIEHSEYPLARIYRESVWTGILDTFHVLIGNHFDFSDRRGTRKGVLDLLIFPWISRRLISYCNDIFFKSNNSFLVNSGWLLAWVVLGIIGCVLQVPRYLLGVSITIGLIPIVALVHAVAYFKANEYKKQLVNLERFVHLHILSEGPEGPEFETVETPSVQKISQLLSRVQWIELKFPGEDHYLEGKDGDSARGGFKFQISVALKNPAERNHPTHLIKMKEKNTKGIEALLATNTGQILEQFVGKEKILREIQEWIKSPPKEEARITFMAGSLNPNVDEEASPINDFVKSPIFAQNLVKLIFSHADIATEKQAQEVGVVLQS